MQQRIRLCVPFAVSLIPIVWGFVSFLGRCENVNDRHSPDSKDPRIDIDSTSICTWAFRIDVNSRDFAQVIDTGQI